MELIKRSRWAVLSLGFWTTKYKSDFSEPNQWENFRERFLDSSDDESRWREAGALKRRETVGALCRRRVESNDEKGNDKLLPSATALHRILENSICTTPADFSQETYKVWFFFFLCRKQKKSPQDFRFIKGTRLGNPWKAQPQNYVTCEKNHKIM